MIYFAFVHAHLAYGIEIYMNTYTNHLNELMILNNKLLHVLDTPVVKLYANFNTLNLPELHTYQILKIVHNLYLSPKHTAIHTHCREHLHFKHANSSLGQRSIKFKGSSYLWNSLPDELKSVISAHSFGKH